MPSFLETLFRKHLGAVLAEAPVPDTDEEMNWRLFIAHSQDMQGFAADIFIGGPNERDHPTDSTYHGVRDLWPGTSQKLIQDLAQVWEDRRLQSRLRSLTQGSGHGVQEGISVLTDSSLEGARLFADRLVHLTGDKIGRKTNRMIRAYVQNSHQLGRYGYSFRQYLAANSPQGAFPPPISPMQEARWRGGIERDFYKVGPAIANYLICDWLLWLWKEGRLDWFESYKADSVHNGFVTSGLLPPLAGTDFVAYCKAVSIPAGHGTLSGKPCPPRVLNACLWLEGNQSSGPRDVVREPQVRPGRLIRRPPSIRRAAAPLIPTGHGGTVLFRDDDLGYCQWLDRNPHGYVLNLERSPRAGYLKLHRSGCSHINGPRQRGQPLTRDYIKLCSETERGIAEWCQETFGVAPETSCYCIRSAR